MNESIGIPCPYCGETLYLEPEPQDSTVEYIEDCHICCNPIVFKIRYSSEGSQIEARKEND